MGSRASSLFAKVPVLGVDPGFLEWGVHMYIGMGVRCAECISFFLNIP